MVIDRWWIKKKSRHMFYKKVFINQVCF
jgi:hypothetical protein